MASNLYRAFSPLVNLLPERSRILLMYAYKHMRLPDLAAPLTFNEKIQWRKLYDRNSLFTEIADKVAVKQYVDSKNTVAKVPKILWQGKSLLQLADFSQLPDSYVIKANHASGTNLIVTNGRHQSLKALKKLENKWSNIRIDKTFVEWGYSNIPITYFVEEYLDFSDFVPVDYKFWVFSGRVSFVQVDTDRFVNHQRAFFDRDWNKLPFLLTYPDIRATLLAPENFADMITVAEKLSAGLDFIRVDLYTNERDVFFGELTVYPGGGYERFSPSKFDLTVGQLWEMND